MNAALRNVPAPAAAGRATMQAIVQRRYGTEPEDLFRLEQIAKPVPARGEVLIRVAAAGVDRGTWHLMAGLPYLARIAGFGVRAPKIPVPGWAVAGTVEAVGEDVTELAPGDEVFGTCRGSFAQYATCKASRLAPKPASLTFEQAAAIPNSAVAALRAVRDHGKVQPGQHVLVIGASGGVGTFAVQIAKTFGAEVTGTCSTAKMDLVAAVGADHVLDYTREDPAKNRYDVIIDIGGNRRLTHLRRALTQQGTLVITGGEDGGHWFGAALGRNVAAHLLNPFTRQRLTGFIAPESRADLLVLRDLAESGAITPAIDRTYPLSQAAAAVRHLADGHARGKVVITV
ncbi:MAG TPA: NAD(P)-dependent alcohol dehydrogenase [Trebonia sp.]|jgi:NADPH:quinone reductase-like Zn-dependent oxidoreductase|nr:NAD(P)-dependent alcohol dehydrogenase [Trebonia sp.]